MDSVTATLSSPIYPNHLRHENQRPSRGSNKTSDKGMVVPVSRDPCDASLHCYDLAHICDKQANYPTAFALGCRAGEILLTHKLSSNHDLMKPIRSLESRITGGVQLQRGIPYSEDLDNRPSPVFLVGFPCSGEDLLQRLLESYPGVCVSTGNQALLHVRKTLDEMVSGLGDVLKKIRGLTPDQLRRLRGEYWRKLATSFHGSRNPFVTVDYNPFNILELGLINAIFPDARVIVTWRDPRDVCVSAFLRPFAFNPLTALLRQWVTVARFYGGVQQYFLQWMPYLDFRMLHVSYESMVSDPWQEMERVLRFVGISWVTGYKTYTDFSETTQTFLESQITGWQNYLQFFEPVNPLLRDAIKYQKLLLD